MGACLTAQFSSVAGRFNELLEVARLEKVSEVDLRHMNKIKDKALAMADRRNRIVHDPWYSGYPSNKHYRLQKTAKARLDFAYKPMPLDELTKFHTEIADLSEEFSKCRSEVLHTFWNSSL